MAETLRVAPDGAALPAAEPAVILAPMAAASSVHVNVNGNGNGINGNGAAAQILRALGLPVLVFLTVIMLASVMLVATAFFTAPQEVGHIGRQLAEVNALSRIAALIIICPSIVVLAVVDKIEGSVAAAVLAAIAGYVLGSTPGTH